MQFVVTASLGSLKMFVKSLQCLHRVSPHLLLVATANDVRHFTFPPSATKSTDRKKLFFFSLAHLEKRS